ncbi:hypothetical protein [Methylobacterium tardum]|uniref:hypothetical protein n=1 Tax=Methylobacterium tardum TaxID=374432 RepID=UPI001EDE30FC|nr:hypothetical protein [Methylobacterium tardum]URD38154.1 hypothetical protein M6G65_06735 [Methylobacterium tardum]
MAMRHDGETRIYAVVKGTVAGAFQTVAALCPPGCAPELVGGLSRDTARARKFKPDDVWEV